ncbi:uncharacterized protein NECHADRAFT_33769 [Fusarium vanettenii 77-13-4]|uniref:F-box domain-containing protein n=1 Tax=Fusarium vanettenii (strain ATCC MYA-4622 / CBS 123669 / FGSC 9596 / NRRL 45880 / 77-13-4) TaxID=660122 RepID=C7Z4N1_FUSV7|nr:uncharacterized protein NECHADRAFT_33769 [Fusarium vanettenii 77-13-4]EEU40952.1 hypothetical protein NECHADRAFT_33769 [Fusarium vanettenii 77-13-4]
MVAEAAGDEAATPPRTALTFLDLPAETQQEILSHCSQSDLICCALVSRHFHDLASAQLYRSFNILFPDDDDVRFESPIDGLAGGLDTFTTSEYNYAKHLRELSMDTVSTGIKAEHAYKPYLYSASCGKFLNTLLYLTLKKAKSLETFRWNIRVELSRPVYRELHKIRTLTKFHIRMQAGETYYTTPPPLPLVIDEPPPVTAHYYDIPPPPPPPVFSAPLAGVNSGPVLSASPPSMLPLSKQFSKSKIGKRGSEAQEPPTLSGFKRLKSLSVLDIDSLESVTELKACVRNSASTLTELHLSLSESMALQARRPPPDSDPDDSDVDDEFQVVPASQSTNFDATGPAKTFRSQEERKLQEAILGRILDVESSITKKPALHHSPRDVACSQPEGQESDNNGNSADPRDEFVSSIKSVSSKLMSHVNGSRDFTSAQQDILDMIEKAARKYAESCEQPSQQPDGPSDSGSTPPKDGEAQPAEKDASSDSETKPSVTLPDRSKNKASNGDLSPDDIEIEHLDMVEDMDEESDEQQTKDSDDKQPEPQPQETSEPASSSKTPSKTPPPISKSSLKKLATDAEVHKVQKELNEKPLANSAELQKSMDDYIRQTRGIALETLGIHLIPVKASVLSRAIDLRCIRNLTLLNVGNQSPIWTMLSKENKIHPLALRSVFTDNVSTAFLTCMSQLDELHDLFMLERSPKFKPESFAPRTTVTIDQIRRLVLKKHMPTLKRLMIKDESNSSVWDANQKAMILICNRGAQLEELALSMNIHAVHAFMQYFAGLVNLRAINILRFRNNDTCIWVMREILNFIVDNLSHHPELKLEWIAMEDDRLDRVIRPSDTPEEAPKRRDKGKEKLSMGLHHNDSALPVLPAWASDSESDEDDDDASNCGKRLRLKTVGVLQFFEVWGVRIFDKEIRTGRL